MLATRRRSLSIRGYVLFLFAWPGVVPDCFAKREPARSIDASEFLAAWARMSAGIAFILALAVSAPRLSDAVLGLAGTAALLLALHLGIASLLPWLIRWAGFPGPDLFRQPWASRSLAEFWGRRWNLAFVETMRCLLLRSFYRRLGRGGSQFAVFAVSGLLHELAISFPAGGGWGLPLGYFLLHGALVAVEKRFRIVNRAWTWFWVIAPAPWLFHEPFRRVLIVPFYRWLHSAMAQFPLLSWALYAAVLGHLLILVASFQVPARLNWKQDIGKLAPFNQRVFWVYGSYIILSIVSFAVLTWRLHDTILSGDVAARWLAGFIATFWSVRVLVDLLWFDARDWPRGNALVLGHAFLTSLFSSLAIVYWIAAVAPRV